MMASNAPRRNRLPLGIPTISPSGWVASVRDRRHGRSVGSLSSRTRLRPGRSARQAQHADDIFVRRGIDGSSLH